MITSPPSKPPVNRPSSLNTFQAIDLVRGSAKKLLGEIPALETIWIVAKVVHVDTIAVTNDSNDDAGSEFLSIPICYPRIAVKLAIFQLSVEAAALTLERSHLLCGCRDGSYHEHILCTVGRDPSQLASVAEEVDESRVKRYGQRIFSHVLTYETSQTTNPFIRTLAFLRVCISGEVNNILSIMTILLERGQRLVELMQSQRVTEEYVGITLAVLKKYFWLAITIYYFPSGIQAAFQKPSRANSTTLFNISHTPKVPSLQAHISPQSPTNFNPNTLTFGPQTPYQTLQWPWQPSLHALFSSTTRP
ncbi:hypothetical protein OIDMADRAFT_56661 [Oidiodendron maius Zn]|uniref:Uncharacterized protein n=1 Tax=Oidiodendron maius (strain Zn) TaxID=913774 RepID=A0A0C3H4L3_OIDMZ|nr:hypothetical protein OIDMADRAFT_56661 [Oidiodendron maius Zn]